MIQLVNAFRCLAVWLNLCADKFDLAVYIDCLSIAYHYRLLMVLATTIIRGNNLDVTETPCKPVDAECIYALKVALV